MKNLIWLFAILIALSVGNETLSAQKLVKQSRTNLSVRPVSLLFQQPNIKFERSFGLSNSFGADFSYFTRMNEGLKAEPFVRFYTSKNKAALEGFYLQTKLIVGSHEKELEILEGQVLNTEVNQERFMAFGGGFGVGNQWIVGRGDNIVLDLYSGLKRYKPVGQDIDGDRFLFSATRNFPIELRFRVGIAF